MKKLVLIAVKSATMLSRGRAPFALWQCTDTPCCVSSAIGRVLPPPQPCPLTGLKIETKHMASPWPPVEGEELIGMATTLRRVGLIVLQGLIIKVISRPRACYLVLGQAELRNSHLI